MATELNDLKVRILGCLVEKELTTPQQYPLTVNALKQACNQKSNRFPTTNYHEGEIGHALREMETDGLVTQAWSTRAARWEHHFGKHFGLLSKDVAVLVTLMLRGPQTAGEIRGHCHRLYEFDDIDDVEYVLDRLAEKDPPMVMELPRQPGQKENRFAQLLAGEPDLSKLPMPAAPRASAASSELIDRIEQLESKVADLMDRLDELTE